MLYVTHTHTHIPRSLRLVWLPLIRLTEGLPQPCPYPSLGVQLCPSTVSDGVGAMEATHSWLGLRGGLPQGIVEGRERLGQARKAMTNQ